MKREREEAHITSLWDLPNDCIWLIMDNLRVRDVQHFVAALLPELLSKEIENSYYSSYLIKRWPKISPFVTKITRKNSLFFLATFISIKWCDACQIERSVSHYKSPNGKNQWYFCSLCDLCMCCSDGSMGDFFTRKNYEKEGFVWIQEKELKKAFGLGKNNSLDYNLLKSVSIKYDHTMASVLTVGSRVPNGHQLSMKLYLLRDIQSLIPK